MNTNPTSPKSGKVEIGTKINFETLTPEEKGIVETAKIKVAEKGLSINDSEIYLDKGENQIRVNIFPSKNEKLKLGGGVRIIFKRSDGQYQFQKIEIWE